MSNITKDLVIEAQNQWGAGNVRIGEDFMNKNAYHQYVSGMLDFHIWQVFYIL